jgi:prephenate dehydrogenase
MIATIIGLGLIGGSLALELRNVGIATHIIGVENNLQHANKALSLGLVDEIAPMPNALMHGDLVIMATPVNTARQLLHIILKNVKSTAVIMDVGSTKNDVCKEFRTHSNRQQFVATHPIAGTEYSGPEAAQLNLFHGKKVIICEPQYSSQASLECVMGIYQKLGAEIIFYQSAQAHDKHAAYVSHISHVSSFMLGLTVLEVEKDEEQILQLAGTGFASTVRLAKSSPHTWTPIFLQNAAMLSQALQRYIANLQQFKRYIDNDDAQNIHRMITESNEIAKIIK